jgi:hypothetical protein
MTSEFRIVTMFVTIDLRKLMHVEFGYCVIYHLSEVSDVQLQTAMLFYIKHKSSVTKPHFLICTNIVLDEARAFEVHAAVVL